MEFVRVRSSTVEAVGYDADNATLGVRFLGGSEYHYFNVPEHVHRGLLTARSVGGFSNDNVKKAGYRFRQVK